MAAPALHENLGVTRLMIVCGVGKRNQDGWQSECGQFGQTGGAGSGNSEIGRAVKFLHPMMKRRDKSGQFSRR